MKRLLILLFLCSCSFEGKSNYVHIKYLNMSNMSLGEYIIDLNKKSDTKIIHEIK
jgi:hypothetical protein